MSQLFVSNKMLCFPVFIHKMFYCVIVCCNKMITTVHFLTCGSLQICEIITYFFVMLVSENSPVWSCFKIKTFI